MRGQPFLALEFLGGGSLEDYLDGRPQPLRLAAKLVETLARTVDYAHSKGVVHRDLKPANILLQECETRNAKCGRESDSASRIPQSATPSAAPLACLIPKIADFGLAKPLDDNIHLTRTGLILGTPRYMAPEQCRAASETAGLAADVYALGIILYELLTGRTPFEGSDVFALLTQVVEDEPPAPSHWRPRLPRDLDCIVGKCLEKDPRRRYLSAKELADDLRRFLNGEPIRARRVGRVESAWRWAGCKS